MDTSILPISPDTPWLAPLAGLSDLPFRLLCREYGCRVAVTEMVSAKGLIYNSPGTQELLQTCPQDAPLVVQLFGAEESFLTQAIRRLRESGFRHFDLNCGCPVKKVVKTGSGAALLKDPQHLLRIAKTMIEATEPGCMGFKIRLGWHISQPVHLALGKQLEDLGAGWITLHPRFGAQGFTGSADWSELANLKRQVHMPVIASGDLFLAEDAVRCVKQNGVDGIMFARGALNNPSIFERYLKLHRNSVPQEKTFADMMNLLSRLCELYAEHGLDRLGLLKMRTLAPRFFKGLPNARILRRDIVFCKTWSEIFAVLKNASAEVDE
jgi:tRNA-dihydrouridine synthase B